MINEIDTSLRSGIYTSPIKAAKRFSQETINNSPVIKRINTSSGSAKIHQPINKKKKRDSRDKEKEKKREDLEKATEKSRERQRNDNKQ